MSPSRRLESRVALCVACGGLPALVLATYFAGQMDGPEQFGLLLALTTWVAAIVFAYRQVQRPLASLSRLVAGLEHGDFSVAPQRIEAGALGALQKELDGLASLLRTQRLDAQEANALSRAVFTHMDVAVLAFDASARLSLINPAAAEALGLSQTADLGRTARELDVDSLLQGPYPRTVTLLRGQDNGERSRARPDRRWVLRVTNVRLGGKPQNLAVLTDVQHALRGEEWSSWQRLVRVLSHEINNSLAPIGSIATTLRDELSFDPTAAVQSPDCVNGLGVIVRRVEGLSRFLQGYAHLARLPTPSTAALQLRPVVERVVRLETRVTIKVEGGPDVTLFADADQLEQLLINLLRNAAEACLQAEGAGVRVRWFSESGFMSLEVEDDGPGLPSTSNLFVPFFTTKESGSGIGLVLCRQIAESHGGTLDLHARPDAAGAIARLLLPLGTPQASGSLHVPGTAR